MEATEGDDDDNGGDGDDNEDDDDWDAVSDSRHTAPLSSLCYAIVPPGRKSGFGGAFRPDCVCRASFKIGSSTGFRPAGGPI